jgi:hypothetical protein
MNFPLNLEADPRGGNVYLPQAEEQDKRAVPTWLWWLLAFFLFSALCAGAAFY